MLAASAAHLGFQATVTLVVYPALAATAPRDWAEVHAAHSRRISLVVGPVYVALAAACLWVLIAADLTGPLLLSCAAAAATAAVTAAVAAPAHSALGRRRPERHLLRRLLLADRVRLGLAAACFVAAVAA